jgi:hypothetical protein
MIIVYLFLFSSFILEDIPYTPIHFFESIHFDLKYALAGSLVVDTCMHHPKSLLVIQQNIAHVLFSIIIRG